MSDMSVTLVAHIARDWFQNTAKIHTHRSDKVISSLQLKQVHQQSQTHHMATSIV